ncbi:MAG: CoA pyrophosphatase [Burkholderiales bacterium]|nr:CoA pyrophosphatase [Burkholderiales bacterium]
MLGTRRELSQMNAPGSPRLPDAQWLRDRFGAQHALEPLTTGDGHLFRRDGPIRPASVLVPVVDRAAELTVLFTRRTAHLHDHAGQISFPGGRAEPDESALDTALRETAEEIGLDPGRIEVLGTLSEYVTVTGYRVTPVVGLVRPPFELQPDAFEVAEVFEVPLAFLLDPANHQRNSVIAQGMERQYYAMPYGPYYIWGATAGMLMNLYRFLTR